MFGNQFRFGSVGVLKHPGYNGKGGGGGSDNTTTGTTYTTNIPEYAQPYVENMLGATQKQLFNMDSDGNITGFQPYNPYSTNPQDYIAGFSPLQQQAQRNTANLQMPGQFGDATMMAGASGLGSLGLAGQAAGAGQQFQNMATNPGSVQAYMNPYLQASLAPQMDAMRRQYGITGTEQQGRATAAGAFGGSREALMAAENNRAMNSAMDNALAQGYSNAFNNAQGQMQFGANLGLQGLQTGLTGLGQAGQAASTMGNLGTSQLAAQQGIISAQNQAGAAQQAQQQQIINQAIQDYANAQQYPMMQLGMMSNMLRGLPMQGVTTQSYQAQPNLITQGIGALGTGYALQNALGGSSTTTTKKAGGTVKSYAQGGIASYDVGGAVKGDLYDYPPQKLQEIARSSESKTVREMANAILKEKTAMAGGGIVAFDEGGLTDRALRGLEALTPLGAIRTVRDAAKEKDSMSDAEKVVRSAYAGESGLVDKLKSFGASLSPFDTPAAPAAQPGGYVPTAADKAAPTAVPEAKPAEVKPAKPAAETKPKKVADVPPRVNAQQPQLAQPATAGGYEDFTTAKGIIGGMDPAAAKYFQAPPKEEEQGAIAQRLADQAKAFLGPDTAGAEYRAKIMSERANAADEAKRQESMRMAQFFSTWGSTPGNTLKAGMEAMQKTIPDLIADKDARKKANAELDKIIYNLDHAERLERKGHWDEATKIKEDQAKAVHTWSTKMGDIATTAAGNKARIAGENIQGEYGLKREGMQNASAEKIAKNRDAVTRDTSLSRKDQMAIKHGEVVMTAYDKAIKEGTIPPTTTIDEYAATHTLGGSALPAGTKVTKLPS